MEQILLDLLTFYSGRPVGPFGTGQIRPGLQVKMQIAWMDSMRMKFRVEQEGVVGANSEIQNRGDQWVPY